MYYCTTHTHRPPLSGINSGWGALGLLSRIVLYLQTNRIVVNKLLKRSSPHYNPTVYRRHCNSIIIKFLVIFSSQAELLWLPPTKPFSLSVYINRIVLLAPLLGFNFFILFVICFIRLFRTKQEVDSKGHSLAIKIVDSRALGTFFKDLPSKKRQDWAA